MSADKTKCGRSFACYRDVIWSSFAGAQVKSRFGSAYHEFKRPFKIVDRNLTDGYTLGFCKMWTKTDSDEILGCTIVGENAGELIGMVTTAMVGKIGALAVASIIAPYPTAHENVKFCAAGYVLRLSSCDLYVGRYVLSAGVHVLR
jgi:pyruvate/2-oxoglutarate dehydrogenase complex dihydrolipoamide dehydrogenase (E3) component